MTLQLRKHYLIERENKERQATWGAGRTLITIDMGDLESEIHNLSTFIKSKTPASITVKGKALVIDSGKEILSARNVKALVKRFLHHKGLTESYRVNEENEVVRITKRKQRNTRKTKKTGTKSSSYDTLPFFFPNRPLGY